jgi:hypothetical protein
MFAQIDSRAPFVRDMSCSLAQKGICSWQGLWHFKELGGGVAFPSFAMICTICACSRLGSALNFNLFNPFHCSRLGPLGVEAEDAPKASQGCAGKGPGFMGWSWWCRCHHSLKPLNSKGGSKKALHNLQKRESCPWLSPFVRVSITPGKNDEHRTFKRHPKQHFTYFHIISPYFTYSN